jgi:hypothetical protein
MREDIRRQAMRAPMGRRILHLLTAISRIFQRANTPPGSVAVGITAGITVASDGGGLPEAPGISTMRRSTPIPPMSPTITSMRRMGRRGSTGIIARVLRGTIPMSRLAPCLGGRFRRRPRRVTARLQAAMDRPRAVTMADRAISPLRATRAVLDQAISRRPATRVAPDQATNRRRATRDRTKAPGQATSHRLAIRRQDRVRTSLCRLHTAAPTGLIEQTSNYGWALRGH